MTRYNTRKNFRSNLHCLREQVPAKRCRCPLRDQDYLYAQMFLLIRAIEIPRAHFALVFLKALLKVLLLVRRQLEVYYSAHSPPYYDRHISIRKKNI